MEPDDLNSLKEDMIAFIGGQDLKRFRGYVGEDINSVTWDSDDNPESWKDFVEVAKASGAIFLILNDAVLQREDLDYLVERLRNGRYTKPEDLDEARWLRAHLGQTGFLQLGWPHQGIMFLYEVSTGWYDDYQRLLDLAEECGGVFIDESDQDDER